ncbi:hypothetical protein [Cereibacter sphaeroides]|uniref:hypothetical protein n=1 Tax=Cereibacter sphaeroides TaxID=1063 RepID=UPI001F28626C|nr:hypothetical protein [Cereibacter sphaeroides]
MTIVLGRAGLFNRLPLALLRSPALGRARLGLDSRGFRPQSIFLGREGLLFSDPALAFFLGRHAFTLLLRSPRLRLGPLGLRLPRGFFLFRPQSFLLSCTGFFVGRLALAFLLGGRAFTLLCRRTGFLFGDPALAFFLGRRAFTLLLRSPRLRLGSLGLRLPGSLFLLGPQSIFLGRLALTFFLGHTGFFFRGLALPLSFRRVLLGFARFRFGLVPLALPALAGSRAGLAPRFASDGSTLAFLGEKRDGCSGRQDDREGGRGEQGT